jgi:PKD repeat protein
MQLKSFLRAIILSLFILNVSLTAYSQTNAKGVTFPVQNFRGTGAGAEIPVMLGKNIGQVAAWYGRSTAELRDLCLKEKSLRIDRQGRLHFVCEGLLPLQNIAARSETISSGGSSTGTPGAGEAFSLHSKPGASKVIYLDFDGHVTSGTFWNSNFTGGGNIVTPPYTNDSTVTTNFSTTELNNIVAIWQRVAEDFAPFDVNVTTVDPGIEALRKTSSSDNQFGVRVCIGGSSYDWYSAGAGGVAYLNSFVWNSDTPCFVFTSQLGNGNVKYTAEAVSHEAGHTFNLSHDGRNASATNSAEAYYEGHGNWAPIMGVGYYKDVVQWSKGDYAFANNTQDDIAMIAAMVGYRADAHGDAIVNATPLTGSTPVVSGIIETRNDADLFGFTTGAGTVTLTAVPAPVSPNLDLRLSLYDGLGNLITSANPSTLNATLTTTLAQGSYYAAVEGIGTGDPSTAYNDYGSLGEFTFSGNLIPTSGAAPVAVATATSPVTGPAPLTVTFKGDGSYDPDGFISAYDWDFGDGSGSSEANPAKTFSVPGTYLASLVVIDNAGLSAASQTITIQVGSNKYVYVAAIDMKLATSKSGYQATATVTVRNESGQVVPNASVVGNWSGVVSGSSARSTGRNGTVSFTSPKTKNRGSFIFTVSGISVSGSTYSPANNVETSDSISTP